MNTSLTRAFLDACHKAKRIITYLPPLPEWMTPRQVKVIDAIHKLSQNNSTVCISDVAKYMEGTMPSITRMITTLEKHGAIVKLPAAADRRTHILALTSYGEELYTHYIENFHNHIAKVFADIDEEEMLTAIALIDEIEALLKNDTFDDAAPVSR